MLVGRALLAEAGARPEPMRQLQLFLMGQPVWRLRVGLKPGESKQLELTPANSTATRDDFPETR